MPAACNWPSSQWMTIRRVRMHRPRIGLGYIVARVLGMNADDKADRARILSMVKAWIKSDILPLMKCTTAGMAALSRSSRPGRITRLWRSGHDDLPHLSAPFRT